MTDSRIREFSLSDMDRAILADLGAVTPSAAARRLSEDNAIVLTARSTEAVLALPNLMKELHITSVWELYAHVALIAESHPRHIYFTSACVQAFHHPHADAAFISSALDVSSGFGYRYTGKILIEALKSPHLTPGVFNGKFPAILTGIVYDDKGIVPAILNHPYASKTTVHRWVGTVLRYPEKPKYQQYIPILADPNWVHAKHVGPKSRSRLTVLAALT